MIYLLLVFILLAVLWPVFTQKVINFAILTAGAVCAWLFWFYLVGIFS